MPIEIELLNPAYGRRWADGNVELPVESIESTSGVHAPLQNREGNEPLQTGEGASSSADAEQPISSRSGGGCHSTYHDLSILL